VCHHQGAHLYLPCCFAAHSASIRRMFASAIGLYQFWAPFFSRFVPVTCPRFMLPLPGYTLRCHPDILLYTIKRYFFATEVKSSSLLL